MPPAAIPECEGREECGARSRGSRGAASYSSRSRCRVRGRAVVPIDSIDSIDPSDPVVGQEGGCGEKASKLSENKEPDVWSGG